MFRFQVLGVSALGLQGSGCGGSGVHFGCLGCWDGGFGIEVVGLQVCRGLEVFFFQVCRCVDFFCVFGVRFCGFKVCRFGLLERGDKPCFESRRVRSTQEGKAAPHHRRTGQWCRPTGQGESSTSQSIRNHHLIAFC